MIDYIFIAEVHEMKNEALCINGKWKLEYNMMNGVQRSETVLMGSKKFELINKFNNNMQTHHFIRHHRRRLPFSGPS